MKVVSPPTSGSNEEALQVIMEAIEAAGYKAGEEILARSGRGRIGNLQRRQIQLRQRRAGPQNR